MLLIRTCNASSLLTIIVLVVFVLVSSMKGRGASGGPPETLGRRSLRTTSCADAGIPNRSSCTGSSSVPACCSVSSSFPSPSSFLPDVNNCLATVVEPGGGGGVIIGTMPTGGASSKSSSCSGIGSGFLRSAVAAELPLSSTLALSADEPSSPGGAMPSSRKSASTLSTIVRNSSSRKIVSTLSRFNRSIRQASRSSCTGASSTIVARNLLSLACSMWSRRSFCSFGFNSSIWARTPSKLP